MMFPAVDASVFTPSRFADQTLIVTGAAGGMGHACAVRAAREGARVVVCDIDGDAAERTASEIRAAGGMAQSLRVDITKRTDTDRMVALAVSAFGGLDVAINNAGVMDGGDDGRPAPLHLASDIYLRRTIDVNLLGTMYSCASELARLVAQGNGGSIVNVGSVTALTGSPGTPAYVASKHGISGLTKSIAIDYAPHGIRCNSVNMAATETPMHDRALAFVRDRGAESGAGNMVRKGIKSAGLIPRNATAWEQAAVILFVASREASDMTGSLVASDGGWTTF